MHRSIQFLLVASLVLSLVAVGGSGVVADVGADGPSLESQTDVVVFSTGGADDIGTQNGSNCGDSPEPFCL